MATKKISELQELETLSNNDLVAVVDTANESTKKMTAKKLGAATGVPTNAIFLYDGETIPSGYEEANVVSEGSLTAYNGSFQLYPAICKKIDRCVNISFNINNDDGFDSYQWVKVATIPTGYRPSKDFLTVALGAKVPGWGSPTAIPMQFLTSGEIQVYSEITGINKISINTSYII